MTRRKKHPGGRPPRDPSGATTPLTVRLAPSVRARCEAAAGESPLATWAAQVLADASGPVRTEAELRAEISDLRRAVIHLHHLELRRDEDAQHARAIREQANDLGAPFSAGAVEERLARIADLESRHGRKADK